MLEEEMADGAGVGAMLPQVAHGQDIAVPLGHLGAAHVEELAAARSGRSPSAGVGAALGDLVLVMGEDQVHRPGVDVEDVHPHFRRISSSAMAEHSMCHPGRPRPNGASHAAPTASSSGLTAFQSTKSRASSLAYSSALTSLAGSGRELAGRAVRPAVRREARDGEVDRPVLPCRRPLLQQPRDQLDHRADVLRGPRLGVRRADAEPVPVLLECPGERVHLLRRGTPS